MADQDSWKAYTPTVLAERPHSVLAEVLVELRRCGACRRPMVPPPVTGIPPRNLFPYAANIDRDAQRRRAGWELESDARAGDGSPICETCKAGDRARFLCALCHTECLSSEIQERIGDPPDYLCTSCYQTTPASAWDAALATLQKAHCCDYR